MATGERSTWGNLCAPQLQIVLLGGRNCGKGSVGNLLLGKEEFVTKERTSCCRRLGAVAGRWLTVVDTPGWWCDFGAQDTSELVKREIASSVSLCPPGPHVFLITIKVGSAFSERRRRAVEEHVALLGERVWSRCIVVLTCDGGAGARAHTAREALRWLGDKCSRRMHSVNLSDEGRSEGPALLDKILTLAAENGNRVFEVQGNLSQVAAGEKKRAEERARQRLARVKTHRSRVQERLRPMTDIRIVLVGAKGSGKTSVLNTILGRDCTRPLQRTAQCVVGRRAVFGRNVTVVDTPGWWMNYFCDETTLFDQREMALSLSLCPPGPHVFLLVIRVDRAFTQTYRRAAQEHLERMSGHIWSGVMVLFAVGDWLGDTTTEQYIESEGEPLRWLVERCGNRYHVLNNKTKGDGLQVRELIGKIELMFAEGGGFQYHKPVKNVVEQLRLKMRGEEVRAKERLKTKEKHRQMARSLLEKLDPLPEMRLLLVGGRKTGKSSCANTILSGECFNADTQTTSCAEKRGRAGGRMVTVLDTPGGFSVTSDLLVDPLSFAILLVVNVSSAFKDNHVEELEKQLEAGGVQMWSRAVVLFSHADWLGDTSIERRIESEGEPMRRLVERCGSRYHVLDNKRLGDGAQVDELIALTEEMLAEERLAGFHRGGHVSVNVSAANERKHEDVQMSCGLTVGGGQIVAAQGERAGRWRGQAVLDRDRFMSIVASMLSGEKGLRWTASGQRGLTPNMPIFLSADVPPSSLRLNGESQVCQFSPSQPAVLLVLPRTQSGLFTEESVPNVQSLCHPVLRERTLRRLTESGGLQRLIDQWGGTSLEELEAFIDTYFEMVWEQTMGSFRSTEPDSPPARRGATVTQAEGAEEEEEEVLWSIDRKLSKLDLLEEIRSDVSQLRESHELSWEAIQQLTDKTRKQDPS